MARKGHTAEQVTLALRQAESGLPVAKVRRGCGPAGAGGVAHRRAG